MAQRSRVYTRSALRFAKVFVATATMALLATVAAGCASGMQTDGGVPRDVPRTDTPGMDAGRLDGGDASTDASADGSTDTPRDTPPIGPNCGTGGPCVGLSRCVDGECVDYPPCRGDNTCPDPGDVCTARRCVPGTDDPDGDGSPASEDCDETDPTRNPDLPEICNLRDDNCNGAPDEGDPAQMCYDGMQPGICMAGTCACPPGTFDIEREVLGCECAAAPAVTDGVACTSAIDVGDLPDTGAMMNLTGNALPNGREVWYSFNAVDTPDTTCDNFHVRVQLTVNPGSAYEMTVFRGGCDPAACAGPMTDFSWATDIAPAAVPGIGECPCSPLDNNAMVVGNVGAPGLNFCSNNTSRFNVRVRRVAGVADSCDAFTLEISNGLYDS